MAKPEKVAYVNKSADGRFTFYRPDGSEIEIGEKPFETNDPSEIAYLDSVEFIKRATSKSSKDDE